MKSDSFTIRPFAIPSEYEACVRLQEETWGSGFSERVSPAILKVSQILGGVSAGAFDDEGTLAAFVFGMTGVRDGELVHWSDMLAVRPEVRDAGLGMRLKEYQREQMLGRGVRKMHWTFDPLQSRNAHLNITKLGAIVREYEENMYGDSDSPLHQGIGTDRFIVLWLLDSTRVVERLSLGKSVADAEAGRSDPAWAVASEGGVWPRPGSPDLTLGNPVVRVAIPSDIVSLMSADVALAIDWRSATRAAFHHYLGTGYEIRGFERGEEASSYLLMRAEAISS